MDRKELHKKVLLCLLASPITLLPFMAGTIGLLGTWVLGLGIKIGFCSFLISLFSGVTLIGRILFGAEGVTRQAMEEMEYDANKKRQTALNNLRSRLQEDGDFRTEELLDDLRALTNSLTGNGSLSDKMNSTSAFDIISGVSHLFEECIKMLERTLEIWQTAQSITNRDATA